MSGRRGAQRVASIAPADPELVTAGEWGALERVAALIERLERQVRHPRHLITREEAARRLALVGDDSTDEDRRNADRTILEMVRRGKLRGVRVGREIKIDPKSIEALIESGG